MAAPGDSTNGWAQVAKSINVESAQESKEALLSIHKTEFLVAHVVVTTKKFWPENLALLGIRTDDAAIFLTLNASKDVHIASFLRRLRSDSMGKRLVMKNSKSFLELAKRHHIGFNNVVDADHIAKKAGWKDVTWDEFCQNLTSGPICLRASVISSKVRPSEMALEHERARLALLHEFNRRFRKFIDRPR